MKMHIPFPQSLLTQNQRIDEQHKELFRIANGFINAIHLNRKRNVLINVLHRLSEYTVAHFACEEKWYAQHAPDRLPEHAKDHAQLKQRLHELQADLFHYVAEIGPQTVSDFIAYWLCNHILTKDIPDLKKTSTASDEPLPPPQQDAPAQGTSHEGASPQEAGTQPDQQATDTPPGAPPKKDAPAA